MEDVMIVAAYVYNRYRDEYHARIDKMKLHKLMYFAQRESLIQRDEPLFDAVFYGWKYGPVLKVIREAYDRDMFMKEVPNDVKNRVEPVMDKVFREYAGKSSWSLSRLTHGELSWKNSRIGIPPDANSDNPILLEDIRTDAERIRERRQMRVMLGLA